MTPQTVRMLTRYNAWANKVIFDAVAEPAGRRGDQGAQDPVQEHEQRAQPPAHGRRDLAGAPGGRDHGIRGIEDGPSPGAPGPLARASCDGRLVHRLWHGLTAAGLDETVSFTLIGGNASTMRRGEILLHVVNPRAITAAGSPTCSSRCPASAHHRSAGFPARAPGPRLNVDDRTHDPADVAGTTATLPPPIRPPCRAAAARKGSRSRAGCTVRARSGSGWGSSASPPCSTSTGPTR